MRLIYGYEHLKSQTLSSNPTNQQLFYKIVPNQLYHTNGVYARHGKNLLVQLLTFQQLEQPLLLHRCNSSVRP
jgi:hypothetical protein